MGGGKGMSRKMILVDSCAECPFQSFTWLSCTFLSAKRGEIMHIPADVLKSRVIWDQCPLDDAEGFV